MEAGPQEDQDDTVYTIPRGQAIQELGDLYAAGDSWLVALSMGALNVALGRLGDLDGWTLYADAGMAEALKIVDDVYYASYLAMVDFANPGTMATVMVIPRTAADRDRMAEVMNFDDLSDTQHVIIAVEEEGPVPYPAMLLDGIQLTDPETALGIRARERGTTN
jgi:hypothetical protein